MSNFRPRAVSGVRTSSWATLSLPMGAALAQSPRRAAKVWPWARVPCAGLMIRGHRRGRPADGVESGHQCGPPPVSSVWPVTYHIPGLGWQVVAPARSVAWCGGPQRRRTLDVALGRCWARRPPPGAGAPPRRGGIPSSGRSMAAGGRAAPPVWWQALRWGGGDRGTALSTTQGRWPRHGLCDGEANETQYCFRTHQNCRQPRKCTPNPTAL